MLLGGLAIILFLRFVVALGKAGNKNQSFKEIELRAQEMFGENYDPADDPTSETFLPVPPPAALQPPLPAAKPDNIFEDSQNSPSAFAMFSPDNQPVKDKKSSFFASGQKAQHTQGQNPAQDDMRQANPQNNAYFEPENPTAFDPQNALPTRFDKVFAMEAVSRLASEEFENIEDAPLNAPAKAALPKNDEESQFGTNPDRRNAITTRSFSPAPRTGRPGKIPFKQGDPKDLDAIDE